jgi:hypothetical protein
MPLVGVGFHTDALSPLWKAATTFRFALFQSERALKLHESGRAS